MATPNTNNNRFTNLKGSANQAIDSASRPMQVFVQDDEDGNDDEDDGNMDEGMDPVLVSGGMGTGIDNILEEEGEYGE